MQAVGVYSLGAFRWIGTPVSVNSATARLWDIADNPASRGLGLSRPAGEP